MKQEVYVLQWMSAIRLRERELHPEAEAEFERRLAADRVIAADSMNFWKRLLDQLELAIAALPALKLTGLLVRRAVSARISIRRPGSGEDFRSVNLFLAEDYIEGGPEKEDGYRLTFVLGSESELAVCDRAADSPALDVEQACRLIVLRLLEPWTVGPIE